MQLTPQSRRKVTPESEGEDCVMDTLAKQGHKSPLPAGYQPRALRFGALLTPLFCQGSLIQASAYTKSLHYQPPAL